MSVLNQSDRPDWVREHRVAALRSAKMLRSLLHYELMEPIAEGGMGAVYRARDTKLNRDVAIKVIREDLAASVNRERFKREIQIAIHLSHPSIVPVYDAGEVDGNLFFVMPLVLGSSGRSAETLSARLSRSERLEVDEATRITADIASGLAHAHAKGIVHRDIKPGNILLAGDRAMVADFGLAVALEAEGDGRITKSGVVPGTPLYMSPEQAAGERPLDPRSDVYSLACVTYEMLSGAPPFLGSVIEVLRQHMTKSPTPLRKIVPELSPQVERVVQRALAKDSVERYQSAEEFAAALSGARDTQESERAEASTILRSLPAGATRRRLRAVVAAAATFVAAGFLLRALLAPPEPAFEPEPTRVVAVLGFENLTGEEALGHVGRGAAHTLASNLATINGLTTISHSMALDITESTDLRAAARDLGVGLFVTGSVLKAGDKLKFIVEVVRADGTIAWGGEFEGSASDLFDIQRRLSEGVVAGLDVDLTPEAESRLASAPTRDPNAYAEYSQARAFLERHDVAENSQRAKKLFESAIARDEAFALAHAGLGETYWTLYRDSRDPTLPDKARAAVERARALDPTHPSVHTALALIDYGTGHYERALKEIDRALELQPGSDDAYSLKARIADRLGEDMETSVAAFQRAIDLRPGYWEHHRRLGMLYMKYGKLEQAKAPLQRVIELQPDNAWGYQTLGTVYHMEGNLDEAERLYRDAISVGHSPAAWSNLGNIAYTRGEFERAAEAFSESLILEEDPVGRRNHGDALTRLGRLEEAKREYERMVTLAKDRVDVNPRDAISISIWALGEAKLGDFEFALRRANEAERIAPNDADVLHRKAAVEALAGRAGEALASVTRAIEAGVPASVIEEDDDFDSLDENELKRILKQNH